MRGDEDGVFSALLQCADYVCNQGVAVLGNYSSVIIDVNYNTETTFTVSDIYPSFALIDMPDAVTKPIKDALQRSFGLYWRDPQSCAAALRTAIEGIADSLGQPARQKKQFVPLATRLGRMKATHPDLVDAAEAIKDFGNEGTHGGSVLRSKLVHAFELLEIELRRIFNNDVTRRHELIRQLRNLMRLRPRQCRSRYEGDAMVDDIKAALAAADYAARHGWGTPIEPSDQTRADKVRRLVESELGRLPVESKPFFEKAAKHDPDQSFMNLSYMAYAYGRAFTEFAEGALDNWPKKQYIVQPMVYLARHSIELNLKWAISEYQNFLEDRSEKTSHHNLTKLWNTLVKLRASAGAPIDDKVSKHCLKLLNHINQIDPDGEQFRYPHKRAGEAFELTKVDLKGLVKAHGILDLYAEASVDMIPDLAEEVTE
jgi:Domain of unknown function (DUF4145)